jgi:hypothetical protein
VAQSLRLGVDKLQDHSEENCVMANVSHPNNGARSAKEREEQRNEDATPRIRQYQRLVASGAISPGAFH